MTKFLNKSFTVGPKAGEKISDEQWDIAVGRKAPDGGRSREGLAVGFFDGGSSSNPGPGASAWALEYPDKTTMTGMKGLGVTTNNCAEYTGLILLLEYALDHGVKRITVSGDSTLIVNQVNGLWKVKDDKLKPLAARAQELAKMFEEFTLKWIPREENTECDALVKKVIKEDRSSTAKPRPETVN